MIFEMPLEFFFKRHKTQFIQIVPINVRRFANILSKLRLEILLDFAHGFTVQIWHSIGIMTARPGSWYLKPPPLMQLFFLKSPRIVVHFACFCDASHIQIGS